MTTDLERAARAALPLLQQYINEAGPCDHSVNICICGLVSTTEDLGHALRALPPAREWVSVPPVRGMLEVWRKIGPRLRERFASRFALMEPLRFTDNERQTVLMALECMANALAAMSADPPSPPPSDTGQQKAAAQVCESGSESAHKETEPVDVGQVGTPRPLSASNEPASAAPVASPPPAGKPELALNVRHPKCHEAADAFWEYWRENGETHKHGYYESTWGAINRAIRMVGVVPHSYDDRERRLQKRLWETPMTTTPTPRTDAFIAAHEYMVPPLDTPADMAAVGKVLRQVMVDYSEHARTLERALTAAEAERDELRRKAGTLVDDCERITGLSISQLDWDAAVVKMLEESKKDAERLTAIETGEVVVVMDEPTGEVRAIRRGLNAFDVQNWVAAKTLRAAIDTAIEQGKE